MELFLSTFLGRGAGCGHRMGYRLYGTSTSCPSRRFDVRAKQVRRGRIFTNSTRRNVMDRSASAVWNGSLKEGKGTISSQSGALKSLQYSFAARFADGVGTNPEELIAAAHAGCFSMALSA